MKALLALVLLSGCAAQPFSQPPLYSEVLVKVHWNQSGPCEGRVDGCSTIPAPGIHQPRAQIWTLYPTGFEDLSAVCTLGHEFLHALGARHP